MDVSNLNSLKVADLKQLLKARGLPLVGNKNELIARLESAMLNDPSGDSGAAASTTKEIDEDAILADDDESFTKPDDSLLHNEDLLLSEPSIETSQVTTKSASSSLPPTNATVSNAAAPSSTANSAQAANNPAAVNDTDSVSSTKQTVSSKNFLTAEQKKQMRALKFADPKIKNRAERFGLAAEPAPLTEEDKLKQRMSRFGEVVSQKAKSIDEKDRLDKRKERFGIVSSTNNSKSNGFKPASTPNVDASIQKRQERFGVVSEPKTKQDNKILPGFKRRRFAY